MPLTMLDATPFASFLVPGLILFLVLGVALVIWIVVQGAMIGMASPLQWGYLVFGFVIVAVSAMASVRRHFARP